MVKPIDSSSTGSLQELPSRRRLRNPTCSPLGRRVLDAPSASNPLQRIRFTMPKCITNAMKAIGSLFRSIFNKFSSDVEPTSNVEATEVHRLDFAQLKVGEQMLVCLVNGSKRKEHVINAMILQGVSESEATRIASTPATTFTAPDRQEFKIVVKHDDALYLERTK